MNVEPRALDMPRVPRWDEISVGRGLLWQTYDVYGIPYLTDGIYEDSYTLIEGEAINHALYGFDLGDDLRLYARRRAATRPMHRHRLQHRAKREESLQRRRERTERAGDVPRIRTHQICDCPLCAPASLSPPVTHPGLSGVRDPQQERWVRRAAELLSIRGYLWDDVRARRSTPINPERPPIDRYDVDGWRRHTVPLCLDCGHGVPGFSFSLRNERLCQVCGRKCTDGVFAPIPVLIVHRD